MTEHTHIGRMAGDFLQSDSALNTADLPRTKSQATDYGRDHHHKPTKAVIGVAIMIVLGFLLYEFSDKTSDLHSSSAPTSQTIASTNH